MFVGASGGVRAKWVRAERDFAHADQRPIDDTVSAGIPGICAILARGSAVSCGEVGKLFRCRNVSYISPSHVLINSDIRSGAPVWYGVARRRVHLSLHRW